MDNWPKSIARKAIADMAAYSARGGATTSLHLDANESPWSPPPSNTAVKDYNRYPEQQPPVLRKRLAQIYGVEPDSIMIGRGADEAIDIIMRTFCEARDDSILICPPTFGYFKIAAQVQGANVLEVPLLDNFTWDISGIKHCLKESTPKAVFLCSPNNPTGNCLVPSLIEELCRENPETLIVVDEAYIEFASHDSITPLRTEYRNLVILRTLSKAYGLAGVRLGVCISDPDIIALMLKVLPPYPIPRPVEKTVLAALAPAAMSVQSKRVSDWKVEQARLIVALKKSKFVEKVYPSEANFILMKVQDEAGLLASLSKYDVKIRDFRYKLPGHFRISVGTRDENDIALEAFGVSRTKASNNRLGEAFRKTNETDIALQVNLDNPAQVKIDTGLGFFDHMLEQIAKHGGLGLVLTCKGDLEIDSHHTVEDTALAFGTALKQALGNKAGIGRYGFIMPMDETQARVAIDLSGRPSFTFKGSFPTDHVGEFAAEMCPHFFQSLSQSLGASIQIDVEGDNTHHMIEACFKGVGRALRPAFDRVGGDIPSTKGAL